MSWIRIQSSEESSKITEFTIQKSQIPEFRKTTEKNHLYQSWVSIELLFELRHFLVFYFYMNQSWVFYFSDFLDSRRRNIPGMLLILTVGI